MGVSNSTLLSLLDRAIGEEGLKEMCEIKWHPGTPHPSGGVFYSTACSTERVASFNNTRMSEQEILDWIDRALIIAESESYQD